eukprot:CAMPEP_0178734904 /NCGR_PEP_ID=MMETSP0744-20121128/1599_1 /TAXON_ID=913974 /ORGANISM="Nitzschia punctata, Strain CCMP561" /LENGTH=476 /DNA_ID=CAMNT_0020387229 /DNA_START=865 /DNA_END=2295 /DNA_ORIENTATION=-
MGELDFDRSTQAKHWMFDEDSLRQCREEACAIQSLDGALPGRGGPRIQKIACGYAKKKGAVGMDTSGPWGEMPAEGNRSPFTMSPQDQETLVHFHAHQIQRLIGPNAIFPLLRRGTSVLSTAIMLFRRFYLSNSVVDFHPRSIAAASALLAVKADCERRIPIDVLSHATWVIQMKAQNAPLCRDELRAVTVKEIEEAERALLQGCDYHLRCHHPYGAIKVLASEVTCYLRSSQEHADEACNGSPRSVVYGYQQEPYHCQYQDDDSLSNICERALSIAQSALVYSDANFLFPPGQIAFAAVALALDGQGSGRKLGTGMKDYLCMRFRNKTSEELSEFEAQIGKIISHLENCPSIDLKKFSPNYWQRRRDGRVAHRQAAEIRRVFCVASRLRIMAGATFQVASPLPPPPPPVSPPHSMGYYHQQHHHHHESGGRKRMREEEDQWTPQYHHHTHHFHPHPAHHPHYYKIARVTPIMMDR